MVQTVIRTLGHKRKQFSYRGSIEKGIVLTQSGSPRIDAEFFSAALVHFSEQEVVGGFKEDDPPPGGFGAWVQQKSAHLNSRKLTPRHGSFMAAVLCFGAGVRSTIHGNSVILHFPKLSACGMHEKALELCDQAS